ncbi:hypothetical protein ES708_30670 [subsurface metagenome]
MTLPKAREILKLDLTYTYPAKFNDLQDAIQVGITAIEIVEEIQIRFPTLIPNLLLGKAPKIDNQRSLHHIKKVLESPLGRECG